MKKKQSERFNARHHHAAGGRAVVTGAVPLSTGAQAATIDFAAGKDMVIGAAGIPPLVINPPAALLHPGAYRAPKTYTGPGTRQQLRALRQRERQAEKKKEDAPTTQGGS